MKKAIKNITVTDFLSRRRSSIGLYNLLFFLILSSSAKAQFCGAPGTIGSSAIHKDSSVFIAWATNCSVTRGYQDIAITSGAMADSGVDTNGINKAGNNPTVSLGDGGSAILTFERPISNETGYDFAIFENGFADQFLELAFVEVSSDGINYVRFPATSNTQTNTQIGAFDLSGDPTLLNNLAGKYRVNFGTPYDLEELAGEPNLDLNAITHVKIIDVVGSIASPYATYDLNTNIINDPYPTAFSSGGFDLDAVGVIHQQPEGLTDYSFLENSVLVYPNPSSDFLFINAGKIDLYQLQLYDLNGNEIVSTSATSFSIGSLTNGIYFLKIIASNGDFCIKKINKR